MLFGALSLQPAETKKASPKKPAATTTKSSAKTKVKTAKKKPAARQTARRRRIPPPPRVSAKQRAEALDAVQSRLGEAAELGIQNAAAMVPFYEMLHRFEEDSRAGVAADTLRVLQFGDSHTASDDWTAAVRERLQVRFGVGGPGFVHAGRPYRGFRRHDASSTMSAGWKPQGLLNREADGLSGLSGVSLASSRAGETLTVEASGALAEIFYLQQPGGGRFTIEEAGSVLDTIDTAGDLSPGFWKMDLSPGPHVLTLRTLSSAPVRIHGWVIENTRGVTWEMLGINGAQADLLLGWNPNLLRAHVERRDPSLIVLAYGTNEARSPDWTLESYKQALVRVIGLLREAAPAASILIVGAPDQMLRKRASAVPIDNVSPIVAAQKDAALETGCAFWNLRAAMGGRGSMQQWVRAGLAQGDYVHLTGEGYRLWGQALYELLLDQYGIFQAVRRQYMGNAVANGSSSQNH